MATSTLFLKLSKQLTKVVHKMAQQHAAAVAPVDRLKETSLEGRATNKCAAANHANNKDPAANLLLVN